MALDKRNVSTFITTRLVNPVVRFAANRGVPLPGLAILETTGRKSGLPRRTPVGGELEGDTFWIVTEHGHRASYVKNIEANPKVCLRVGRSWRHGTARTAPEEDPGERLRRQPRANAAGVRVMGTQHIVIRVDLDPS
jgi:deazaflavin-dependent oxidoreductase (nitroreductase family)